MISNQNLKLYLFIFVSGNMSQGEESLVSSDFEDSSEVSSDETDYFDSLTPQIRPENVLLPEYSSCVPETSEDEHDPDIPPLDEEILWRPVRRPSPFSTVYSFPDTDIMEIINARLADFESEEENDGDNEEEHEGDNEEDEEEREDEIMEN